MTRPPALRRRTFILAAVGFPALVVAMSSVQWVPYYQLERGGREIRARVVRTRPDMHGDLDLMYSVAGREYFITTSPGRGNPGISDLHPGDSVNLTYLPARPELARGGLKPRGTLLGVAGLAGLFAVGVLAALASILALERHAERMNAKRAARDPLRSRE